MSSEHTTHEEGGSPTKKAMILEAAEELGKPRFTPAEIEQIRRKLIAQLGAAESGDHAAAMRLVSAKGANVNATEADGTTAIMYAAANDDLELVRALIKAGANVKLKNQLGTSALTEASIIGNAPIVEALLL